MDTRFPNGLVRRTHSCLLSALFAFSVFSSSAPAQDEFAAPPEIEDVAGAPERLVPDAATPTAPLPIPGLPVSGAAENVPAAPAPAPAQVPASASASAQASDEDEAEFMAASQAAKLPPKLPAKHESKATAAKPKKKRAPTSATELDANPDASIPDRIESFDFRDADIVDVAKAISQLTQKNFIVEPGVRGKITILAPSQITVAEAYKAFLSALAANGYSVVASGAFLKIKPAQDAKRDAIKTYAGADYPKSDIMITRILHLKHISAEEVNRQLLRILPSKNGEMTPYPPTNSLIISDYGANIERIARIIEQLDRPGFDEQLEVIPVRYAKAKDVADIVTKIINKESGSAQAPGAFGGMRPLRPNGAGGGEELSIVAPDERTNAVIVLGNEAGIEKVRGLLRKLDYKLDAAEEGGVNVYYVKNGEAEKLAQTINGVAGGGAGSGAASAGAPNAGFPAPPSGRAASPLDRQNIFGGDVKVVADKNTNSLVITASKQDFTTVRKLLEKLDIPRDQVYIEAVIMELAASKNRLWDVALYRFQDDGTGTGTGTMAGRSGYGQEGTLAKVLDPTRDAGAILSFGTGGPLKMNVPMPGGGTQPLVIPSILAFINFLQTNTDTNILATPQLLATDNEEAFVEVGTEAPVGASTQTTGSTVTTSTQREKLTTKLIVTPFIRPESDAVRMKIKIPIKQLSRDQVSATNLAQNAVITTERNIETNIVVRNGDTAVLGGLIRDQEDVSESKVPILGDIPVLGWLFRSNQVSRRKLNLLVFITPKIIRTPEDSQMNFIRKARQRIDWIKQNNDGRDPYGRYMDELPRAQIPVADEKVETKGKNQ